jgi:hypothetical protein
MAARTVTGLIGRHGILPGRRALLVGGGQELATAAERLGRAGVAITYGPVRTDSLVSIRGRRRVTGAVIAAGRRRHRVSVDLVVFGDRSPNLDLVLAAGGDVTMRGDTLTPRCDATGRTTVASLFVAGSAAGRPVVGVTEADVARKAGRAAAEHARGVAVAKAIADLERREADTHTDSAAAVARGAMVCFCEDVRAWEIRAEQAAGYDDPELVKRRTGALTGPCQGKHCLQSFACFVGAGAVPTARPPLRPVRLGHLVAADADEGGA